MKSEKVYVGIDLGGTTVNIGFVEEGGKLLEEKVICTDPDNPKFTIERIANLINVFFQNHKEEYIHEGTGIGLPGILDISKGVVIEASNLQGWKDFAIKKEIEDRMNFNKRIVLENDANIAALGEQWMGAGQGSPDMFMVTLGTGVGGALIVDHKIFKLNGISGEFGHVVIDIDGFECPCGRRGCVETFISKHGLKRKVSESIKNYKGSILGNSDINDISPQVIANAAKMNDKLALDIFNESGNALGIALANIVNLLGVQRIVIGGGIANAWDILKEPIYEAFSKYVFNFKPEKYKILRATLGEKAGFYGAVKLAMEIK